MNDTQERLSGRRRKTGGNDTRGRQEFFTMRFHFIVSILLCLSWGSVEAAEYKYPYHDPYLATATTAILNDDGFTPRLKSEMVHVSGLANRNQLPSLEGRGE